MLILNKKKVHIIVVLSTANKGRMARRPPPAMTIADVENLFVEKLTEKYLLTESDLHRAFKKYDLDGSGFLDLTELSTAIQHFIPGIQRGVGKRYHVFDLTAIQFFIFPLDRYMILHY